MKKLFLPFLLLLVLPFSMSSCGGLKNYTLTQSDAEAAIRELLQIGSRDGLNPNAFSKQTILSSVFPSDVVKVLNTLNQLGLTSEVDRFTTTLATATQQTAERSVPVFVNAIAGMRLSDAIAIVKQGGTSATDYLRSAAGTQLRDAVKPVMAQALSQYNLTKQWETMTAPVKGLLGNRVNIDLATITAGLVTEKMFQKIAEKEQQIRTNSNARTSLVLRRVFGS
jgi:hypothetical protein